MDKADTRSLIFPKEIPLSQIDRRYFAYVATLESPLDSLALNRRTFTGKDQARPMTSLREVHPLVTSIPWLFRAAFPALSQADLLDISEAGVFLFMALLLQDYHLDGQSIDRPEIPLLHQQLQAAARQKFQTLFEAQSPFWAYFDNYLSQYRAALLQEKSHWDQVTDYSVETMYEIGSGKVALFKTMTAALAVKADAQQLIPKLDAALDALTAALQLGDDIEDWADDYQHQNYTLPLTWAIPPEHRPVPDLPLEIIGQRFQDSVILETLLVQVTDWFQQALDAVTELRCTDWIEFVEHCLTLTRHYHRSLIARKICSLWMKSSLLASLASGETKVWPTNLP